MVLCDAGLLLTILLLVTGCESLSGTPDDADRLDRFMLDYTDLRNGDYRPGGIRGPSVGSGWSGFPGIDIWPPAHHPCSGK